MQVNVLKQKLQLVLGNISIVKGFYWDIFEKQVI